MHGLVLTPGCAADGEPSEQLQRAHSKLTRTRPKPAKTWPFRTKRYVKFLASS